MNDFLKSFISWLIYVAIIFFGTCIYNKLFTKCLKSFNYFGYIIDSKQVIEKKMNSLKPFEVKNLINELSTFKFSSFITYIGFIVALLSFTISQLSNVISKQYLTITIITAVVIVLGSFLTWINYNDCVLYVKEYFYKNFDSETYELKQ